MSRQATPRLLVLLVVGVAGSAAALLSGTPELLPLTTTALAWVVLGTLWHRWPDPEITVRNARDRVVEGDRADIVVSVASEVAVDWLELQLETPSDLVHEHDTDRIVISLGAGRQTTVRFGLSAPRWGVVSADRLRVTARDRFGLFVSRRVITVDEPLRVHPTDRNLDAMLATARTLARVGNHHTPQRADGIEYADIRPWRPGDDWRNVSWKVSARRGEPWTMERHPERASDLILVLDSSQGLGSGSDSTLHAAVRAAIALAEGHLQAHDRVGLLDVGRSVRWFRPAMGRHQLRRLIDALLDTRAELGLGIRRAADLPASALNGDHTLLVFTPLLDSVPVSLISDLAMRGRDVAVLWCAPDTDRIRQGGGPTAKLARRVWELERVMWQRTIEASGVPIVPWRADAPLEIATALIDQGRRRATASR